MAQTAACTRAREWASRRLDGDLSEFEGVLLEAHLAGCEACRIFDSVARALTEALRVAPLEPLRWPVTLPRPRRRLARSSLSLAVAGVAALVLSLSLVSTLSSSKPTLQPQPLELTSRAPREEPYPSALPCALELGRNVPRHTVGQYCG